MFKIGDKVKAKNPFPFNIGNNLTVLAFKDSPHGGDIKVISDSGYVTWYVAGLFTLEETICGHLENMKSL